jgi:calcineurin-like phosphoesterase family protein
MVWLSTDTVVAAVDSLGLATPRQSGTTWIVAHAEGRRDSAFFTVTDPVLVGAGDIARCDSNGDEATASLVDTIPGAVFTAGDNAYESGTDAQYRNCYHPSWGRHVRRTHPAPGNHEYYSLGAGGYYRYFGAKAGDPTKGYYSYELGRWHIIVVNSNVDMSAGSPQEQWLRNDLALHPTECALAYLHHPLFNSGPHGSDSTVRPMWRALYDAGADVVISAHEHIYERFAPQAPDGILDTIRGIRQFTVGTGGASHHYYRRVLPNSEVRDSSAFGVLKLTLHGAGYDWRFIPIPGQSFTDSGSSFCH